MKYKFLLNSNYCFSKLVTTFLLIMYNFLSAQSVVTNIVRNGNGNIVGIEYYNKVSKNLELLKLETFHPNGHVARLELFSSGVKNGVHKEFFNNGNIKIDGQYSDGYKSGLWTEYFRGGGTMRRFYSNENGKNGRFHEWYKNGGKKIRGEYSQGQKNGLWTAWHLNGVKESVVTFNQGEQEGVFSYFYDNGNKKSEGIVSYKGQKEQRCWDIYGNTQNCIKGD